MVFRETLNKLREVGKWEELVQSAQTYLEDEPGSSFGLRALEQAHGHLDHKEEQADTWRRLVEEADETYPYARQYAEYLDALGKSAEAVPYYRVAARAAILEKKYQEVEDLWMLLSQKAPEPLSEYMELADLLEEKGQGERAGMMLQMLLPYYQDKGKGSEEFGLARRVGRLLPTDREARDAVAKCYQNAYGDRPDFDELLERSGLLSFTPIPEAMERLEFYLQYGAGTLFWHIDWGAGRVKKLDIIRMRLDIDFEKKPNHNLTVELAQNVLRPLEEDDWRAVKAFRKEEGRQWMQDEPVALVVSVLKSLGGKASGRDIKERLLQFPVSDGEWTKWWAATNKLLKKDPHVAVSGGGAKTYALREEAITYEEEIRLKFDRARGILDRAAVLEEYAQHYKSHEGDPAFLTELAHETFTTGREDESPATVVDAMFIREKVAEIYPELFDAPDVTFDDYLNDISLAREILIQLGSTERQQRWLTMMRDSFQEEWPVLAESLFKDPRAPLKDALADDLEGMGRLEFFRNTFQEVLADPRSHYVLFSWFVRRVLPKPDKAEAYGVQRSSLLRQCFPLLDYLSQKSRTVEKAEATEMRSHASAIREILKRNSYAVYKDVLGQADTAYARALHRTVASTIGMETRQRDQMVKLIEQRFPDVFLRSTEVKESDARVTYCLRDSLERMRKELRQLLEEEIPQNAKDIDTARQHGDLSENAEYKAAKERQTLLQVRATELQNEIRSAHVPDLSAVKGDRAVFGTRVRARALDEGHEVEYLILGPWESNPDEGIISYKSALGRAFLNKPQGETVTAELPNETRRFEILEIRPAQGVAPSAG